MADSEGLELLEEVALDMAGIKESDAAQELYVELDEEYHRATGTVHRDDETDDDGPVEDLFKADEMKARALHDRDLFDEDGFGLEEDEEDTLETSQSIN